MCSVQCAACRSLRKGAIGPPHALFVYIWNMGIKRFEDILGWQEARKLTKMVYSMTVSGKFARDFGLKDQLQRASVSVMANLAEGFGAASKNEFARFLGYARRSALEVQSLLYVALDSGYLDEAAFQKSYQQAEKTLQLVSALKLSLLPKTKN